MYKELLQLQETTSLQRSELISKLVKIIKDPVYLYYNYAIEKTAVDTLSQIQAIEAIDDLLDIVEFTSDSAFTAVDTVDPKANATMYPVVGAIIKIRPPYELVINKLKFEENVIKFKCYISILLGTEGVELTRYLIEKAIKKETNTRKLRRLNDALDRLNRDYPKDSNDVKPK